VAARIAFFAPVSLLFFVTVVLLVGGLKGVALHPMHVFFVAAGFFAFHLLFAYLVDLVPLHVAFAIAALASLVLVCGYLRAVGGACCSGWRCRPRPPIWCCSATRSSSTG
jgi:inner membrane protein involved in colicin E2 resistance